MEREPGQSDGRSKARTKKPSMELYLPKRPQAETLQPKEKLQTASDGRNRPRYTDKARKNRSKKAKPAEDARNGDAKVPTTEECGQTDGPCDPTERPCDQTAGPCDPTERPCDQTAGPCDPTERPCDQTDGPGEPRTPEETEGENWDSLFNDDGDCVDPHQMKEMSLQEEGGGRSFDYYNWRPEEDDREELELREEELSHILEIYDFPTDFKTEDLIRAFSSFQGKGFDIRWIDDTHALGLFSSPIAAHDALMMKNPLMKVRSLSKSSNSTKAKARSCSDYLLPARERPQTSAALARRLVTNALGVRSSQTREEREAERNKLRQAREEKRLAAQQREDAWEGR